MIQWLTSDDASNLYLALWGLTERDSARLPMVTKLQPGSVEAACVSYAYHDTIGEKHPLTMLAEYHDSLEARLWDSPLMRISRDEWNELVKLSEELPDDACLVTGSILTNLESRKLVGSQEFIERLWKAYGYTEAWETGTLCWCPDRWKVVRISDLPKDHHDVRQIAQARKGILRQMSSDCPML